VATARPHRHCGLRRGREPRRLRLAGRVHASWTLSRRYGFHEADGSKPDWGAHFQKTYGERELRCLDDTFYAYWESPAILDQMIEQAHHE
jgi:hypothetical protein